jgi:hypothetical protein
MDSGAALNGALESALAVIHPTCRCSYDYKAEVVCCSQPSST